MATKWQAFGAQEASWNAAPDAPGADVGRKAVAILLLAALLILREAWIGVLDPKPLNAPLAGLAVNAIAARATAPKKTAV